MYAPSPQQQRWNTAVIGDQGEKTFGAFEVGAEVHGAKIVSILDTRVCLDHAGVVEVSQDYTIR
jgi:hypothetical protein